MTKAELEQLETTDPIAFHRELEIHAAPEMLTKDNYEDKRERMLDAAKKEPTVKKLSVSDCESLKRLDIAVYADSCSLVETNHGEARVRKALTAGYIAELGPGEIPETYAYGPTPAISLLNLIDTIERETEAAKVDNVLIFQRAS